MGRLFKSPFSYRTHVAPDYDDDYVFNNSETKERSVEDFNNEVVTQTNYMQNKWSTSKKVYNDVVVDSEQMKSLSEKPKRRYSPNKYYNR